MNCARVALGLVIPFFIEKWEASVGLGWVFGMMAFFSLIAFSLAGVLAWKGETIRRYSFASLQKSEDGVQLIDRRTPGP